MVAGHHRRIGCMAKRRPDVLEAVGAHAHSDAAAAYQYAEIGLAR